MGVADWVKGMGSNVQNIGSGEVSNGVFQKIGFTGDIVFQVVLFCLLLGAVIFIARQMMMYSITMYVYRKYNTGLKLYVLKGRKFKDKQGRYMFKAVKSLFQLIPMRMPLVDQEYFISKGKGEAVYLLQVGPDDYKPVRFEEELLEGANSIKLSILNQNASNHTSQIHREIVERHKSANKMLIYLPTIMMVGGMIFVVVLLWMTLGRVETISAGISQAGIAVADALKDAGKCVVQ